ncbi:acyl-CoA carboxylase subunit beta [Geomicrobium sp. JSM 1781026]|uniref:acyl-CoA carboxylase subunit beta n=1 Tax=Geomicrobium sp. JSM 1781026 TaxID=3344580 RepID=UPI0035BFCFC0
MEMNDAVDKLNNRKQFIEAGGGESRAKSQKDRGKQTARERIDQLVDTGTFHELYRFHSDQNSGVEGVVTGTAEIHGRDVCVFAQDFTVNGGSLGKMHSLKITKLMDLAMQVSCPIIGLCDSAGARIQEGVSALEGYGQLFYRNVQYSGKIPQISVIMGPCAGGAVYSPALTDFVFMVKRTSHMFLTGGKVLKSVGGKEVNHHDLGGSELHGKRSGDVHFIADNEEECLQEVRKLLAYLPQNATSPCPSAPAKRKTGVRQQLRDIVPVDQKKVYNMKSVIQAVFDANSFMEVQREFAMNMVVGFARLQGETVGIVANNPKVKAGAIDINASDKAARFIRFCNCFQIPIVTFEDVTGFIPGVEQQESGIIRHGAKLLYAYAESGVPKVTVIIRKAYGGAYVAMNSKAIGADLVYAWPIAEVAVMGAEGAVEVLYHRELSESENPEQLREEKIKAYKEEYMDPYYAALLGQVDDIIDPMDTPDTLAQALRVLRNKKRPATNHGNMPL